MKRKPKIEALEQRRLLAVYLPQPDAADGDVGSLRAAIVDAQANDQDDSIRLSEGVYRITQGDMPVNESGRRLEIIGEGREETIIVIDSDSRWLDVNHDAIVDLSGVTVLGGHAEEGGQIRSAGDVTITDARLQAGRARQGGSILNGGNLQLTEVEFWANKAGWGGAIWNHAGATIDSQSIDFVFNRVDASYDAENHEDRASLESLGIQLLDDGLASDVYLRAPTAAAVANAGTWSGSHTNITRSAGGLYAVTNFGDTAELELEHWIAHQNETNVLMNFSGQVTLTQSDVFDNQRSAGGLLMNYGGAFDLFQIDLFNNTAEQFGQTLWSNEGNTRLEEVRLVGNLAWTYDDGTGLSPIPRTPHPMMYTGLVQSGYTGYLEMTNVTVDENEFILNLGAIPLPPSADFDSDHLEFVRPANLAIYGGYRSGGGNRIGAEVFDRYASPLEPLDREQLIEDVFLDTADVDEPQATFGIDRQSLYPTDMDHIRIEDEAIVMDEDTSVAIAAAVPPLAFSAALSGVTSRDASGALIYQPDADFFGQDLVTFLDSRGQVKWQVVTVNNQPDPPIAKDNHFVVLGRSEQLGHEFAHPETAPEAFERLLEQHGIDATALSTTNDRNAPRKDFNIVVDDDFGPDGDVRVHITNVTKAKYGYVGRIQSTVSESVTYIPPSNFAGIDSFEYTITNSSGLSSSANVTIEVLDPNQHPKLAEVRAEIVDADGNSVERVRVGETFFVETSIQYTGGLLHPIQSHRKIGTASAGLRVEGSDVSIAETYVDDAGQIVDVRPRPIAPYTIDFGPAAPFIFQRSPSRLELAPQSGGIIDGAGPHKFYRFPIVAGGIGQVTVTMDPTFGDFLSLVGYGDVPHDWVTQVGDRVQVVGEFTNIESPEDVNQDQTVSAMDALIVINAMARHRATGQVDGELAASRTAEASRLWDVDGNGELTALDALRVINRISRQHTVTAATSGLALDDDEKEGELLHGQGISTIEPEAVDKIFSAS